MKIKNLSTNWHYSLALSRMRIIAWSFSSILAVLLNISQGWTQSINPVPSQSPELPSPTPLKTQEETLQIPSIEEPTPSEEIPDIPGEFTFESFEFVGGTIFSEKELQAATAEFIGKPITFPQLLQAANKVTELYLEQGYITSGAYIPEQQLESNSLKIQIVESSLSEININITKGRLNKNYIRNRILRGTTTPLNINSLQEALQLLQLNPLIETINAELASGSKRGTNILDITVSGTKTFGIKAILNNNRNPSVGTFERGIEISEDNLLGIGDGLSLAYLNTDGSNQFDGRYTLPINSDNGTVGFRFRIFDNEIVEPPFDDLDIKSDTNYYDFIFRQPIIRTASSDFSQELALGLTFSREENETSLLGQPFPLSQGANEEGETRLSVLRFFQEWTRRDRSNVILTRSQFNLGVDAFNATINNEEPDSRFFAWRGQAQWLRFLAKDTSLLLRSDIQLSTTSLVPIEQFGLGGFYTVRGYRQDALLTDNGIVASAEVRLPIARVPKVQGILQLTPFIDFGTSWNTDRDVLFDKNTLVGTGLGLLWQSGNNFTARLDWGIPLVDIDSRDRTWQENGIYLQLEYNLKLF